MIVVVAHVCKINYFWFEVWNYNTYFNGEYSQFKIEMYYIEIW